MKSFNLWRQKKGSFLYDMQEDNETNELVEMARASRPDRLVSRFDSKKKSVGDSLSKGPYLQALVDYLNKNKTLPINGVTNAKTKTGKVSTRKIVASREFKVTASEVKRVIKQIELSAAHMDPVVGGKSDERKAKDVLTNLRIRTSGGTFTIFDVDDSAWKPPAGRKMGGGETPVNQSYQCVISACMANKILPFPRNADIIAKHVEIGSFSVEEVLRSRDYTAINKQKNWSRNAVTTHQVLTKHFGSLQGYKFVEESDKLGERINAVAIKLWNEESSPDDKLSKNSIDRWNPADIWLMKNTSVVSKLESCESIQELNQLMVDYYNSRELIAVSMKAPGSNGKISFKNDEKIPSTVEFESKIECTLTKSRVFGSHGTHQWKSPDGKIILRVASYKGTSLTLQLTDKSTSADAMNAGGISFSTIDQALKKYNLKLLSSGSRGSELRKIYEEGFPKAANSKFWKDFERMYNLGPLNGPKLSASELRATAYSIVDPTTMNPIKAKAGDSVYATYANLNFLDEVLKKSASIQKKIVYECYKWCSSQTPMSSIHVVVGSETSKSKRGDNSQRQRRRRRGVEASNTLPDSTDAPLVKPKKVDPSQDPRWTTFERLKRDDIKNLKDKKGWKKDLKSSMTFDELRSKWTGVGKISKSGTSDEDLRIEKDKFS